MIDGVDFGAIRELRLARPPVNALDAALLRRLAEAVAAAPSEGCRGLILTGSGTRYTGGLDLDVLLDGDPAELRALLAAFFALLDTLAKAPLPIVAAINGSSPAGGAVLSLFCDLRLMAEGPFWIGLNEVRVGLYPGPLILDVLARVVGAHRAGRLLAEGTMLAPSEALAVGLVDGVVAADGLHAQARAWLEGVLALPDEAYRRTRRLVREPLIERMTTTGEGGRDALLDELVGAWSDPGTRRALTQRVRRPPAR